MAEVGFAINDIGAALQDRLVGSIDLLFDSTRWSLVPSSVFVMRHDCVFSVGSAIRPWGLSVVMLVPARYQCYDSVV